VIGDGSVSCACGKVYHKTCAGKTKRCHACGENLS